MTGIILKLSVIFFVKKNYHLPLNILAKTCKYTRAMPVKEREQIHRTGTMLVPCETEPTPKYKTEKIERG
jgi:hypothetical protein